MILCRDPQYGAYLERLGEAAGVAITDLDSLEQAVELRLDAFVACGCKFTDVGIPFFPNRIADREEAAASFAKVQAKKPLTDEEYQGFVGYLYVFLGRAYAKRNLVMQLHLGVMRNVNGPLFAAVGPDAGGDCTGDPIPGVDLARILGAIEEQGGLPETILYCLNPSMAQQLAAIAGSFRRVRSGAAWWFCDHKRGIEEQLNVVAEVGHLGRFLGMLTDSRSFLSYARHDYFRRILCNLLGQWVDADELELSAAEKVARGVCSENIRALIEE
jgi:glucuronate isomerase